MCVDIRMKSGKQRKPFNVNSGLIPSSKTCIKMMEDENYFMASEINGLVCINVLVNEIQYVRVKRSW